MRATREAAPWAGVVRGQPPARSGWRRTGLGWTNSRGGQDGGQAVVVEEAEEPHGVGRGRRRPGPATGPRRGRCRPRPRSGEGGVGRGGGRRRGRRPRPSRARDGWPGRRRGRVRGWPATGGPPPRRPRPAGPGRREGGGEQAAVLGDPHDAHAVDLAVDPPARARRGQDLEAELTAQRPADVPDVLLDAAKGGAGSRAGQRRKVARSRSSAARASTARAKAGWTLDSVIHRRVTSR